MQMHTNYSNSIHEIVDKTDARQGRRIKGMPTVLAISTVAIAFVFALMLIAPFA